MVGEVIEWVSVNCECVIGTTGEEGPEDLHHPKRGEEEKADVGTTRCECTPKQNQR